MDSRKKLAAMDTENDPTGTLGAWSIAFRSQDGTLCVLPANGCERQQELRKLFANSMVAFHNYRWDSRVLARNKMPVPHNYVDTMIAAYVMGFGRQASTDSSKSSSGDSMVGGLGLKYLARRQLGLQMKTWEQIKDKPELVPEYNAMDSIATYMLFEKWRPDLPKHFWTIDMPLLDVLMTMEDRGMKVDPAFLRVYAETLDKRLAEFDLPINPYSPKQVQEYVYGTLGIEPTVFTDNKQPSTGKEVLETIDDPIVKRILEYRELYKEKRTYVSSYANRMDAFNRVHPEFKQTSTATGRLSCARPNLQNVTKETDLRKLFVPEEGKTLVRLDFSQLELRVFAALTGERHMLKALAEGRSIHKETADSLGVPYDDAKTINFLMLYGGTAWKISQEFHIPVDKAQRLIDQYYRHYPGIQSYHENQVIIANNEKKITNFFGRTRRLDSMYSEHWRTKKEGEREAINTPVQGTAADIVKIVMIDLHENYSAPMICQVHDELLFEVPDKEAKDYCQWLTEHVPTLVEINGVKFPVEVGQGKNWMEAKKNS